MPFEMPALVGVCERMGPPLQSLSVKTL